MWKMFAGGVCLLFLMLGVFWAQETQPQQTQEPSSTTEPTTTTAAPPVHAFVITPEDKARKNPEKFTEESVDKGKSVYSTQCAMCHGTSGDGKGDLAGIMHLNLPDMTKPDTLAKYSDGEISAMINSGSGAMPGEAHRMKANTVWDLVNFLRSVEGKKPEKSSHKEPK
ncbi:MAG TPA: cytochrome c [Terriglobia bacterium]|nr:cytochrome c [Terriglobia bacterium]